ncbi:hypothetical protein BC828DRAFT_363831 [Blastocladiella britannica]|nr:hypothetical protein BC828DRAFT_363831 [Blastocladiella britannica]
MTNLFAQTAALVRKNALVLVRSPIQLFIALFMPLIAIGISIATSGAIANSFTAGPPSASVTNPAALNIAYPECTASARVCALQRPRVFYAPNDVFHAKIMAELAAANKLDPTADVIGFGSTDDLMGQVLDRQPAVVSERKVNFAIAFTTFSSVAANKELSTGGVPKFASGPADLAAANGAVTAANGTHYTLFPVGDSGWSAYADPVLPNIVDSSGNILMKHALDRAILQVRASMAGVAAPKLQLQLMHFPLPGELTSGRNAPSGGDARKSQGQAIGNSFVASFIVFGFCPLMLSLVSMLSTEKSNGLIGVLRKLGMSETAYWLSNLLTAAVLCAAATLISLIALPFLPESYPMYNWSPFLVFVVLFLFAFHLVSIGFLLVAALSGNYSTNILVGFICMICILGTALFGIADGTNGVSLDPSRASSYQTLFKMGVLAWILSLLPMLPFGKIFAELTTTELNKKVTLTLASPNITLARTFRFDGVPTSIASTQTSMLFTIITSLVIFVLCGYANQIVGGPQRLWFPLSPSYWGIGSASGDPELDAETRADESLAVRNLKKVFSTSTLGVFNRKSHAAVKDVSFIVRKGRVLSLLGTNGAGKSTTINMITGLLRPDGGVVSCNGTGNPLAIQRQIGVVPQHDITWPLLTAGDHVRLYAAFRGCDQSDTYVADRLGRVGLENHADQLVGKFSGGMRRRCCIVLSSVGEPPLVVLDEPTASLDPINRRKVWAFIRSLKSHAAVVLTTHLLDEADALGDSICIIDAGQVKASGSSLALKKQYGSGYEISLLACEHKTIDDIRGLVLHYAPQATVAQRSTDMFTVTVSKEASLTPLLRFLQSSSPARLAAIREFEVSNTSLERVFLNVAESAKLEREAATTKSKPMDDTTSEELAPFQLPVFEAHKSLWSQVLAVVLKNWAFQRKQMKATITILLASVVILGLYVYAMSQMSEVICPGGFLELKRQNSANGDTVGSCNLADFRTYLASTIGICSPSSPAGCFPADFSVPKRSTQIAVNSTRFWASGNSDAVDAFLGNSADSDRLKATYLALSGSSPSSSTFSVRQKDDILQALAPIQVNKQSTDVAATIKTNLQRMYKVAAAMPSQCASPGSSSSSSLDSGGDGPTNLYVTDAPDIGADYVSLLPDYGLNVAQVSAASTSALLLVPPSSWRAEQYFSAISSKTCARVTSAGGYSIPWSQIMTALVPSSSLSTDYIADLPLLQMVHAAANMQLRKSLGRSEGIHGAVQSMPSVTLPIATPNITAILLPMAVYLLFYVWLVIPFSEKESALYGFYRVNGLSVSACWLGHYIFAFLFAIPSIAMTTVIFAIKIPSSSLLSFIVAFLVAVHGAIALAFVLAAAINSISMARLTSIVFSPAAAVFAGAMVLINGRNQSLLAALFSPLVFAANIHALILQAPIDWVLTACSFVVSCVYIILAITAFTVGDKVRPLEWVKNKLSGKKDAGARASSPANGGSSSRVQHMHNGGTELAPLGRNGVSSSQAHFDLESGQSIADEDEDDEVRKDRLAIAESVHRGDRDGDRYAVKVFNVDKTFGSHRVLQGMNLALTPGVVYGLLGHNGCGKTTLLNILTGVSRPTSGMAWIRGSPTSGMGMSEMSAVVGVVPQQDMVVGDISVADNLRFFARIRGAPLSGVVLEGLVSRCIELVGLQDSRDRPAAQLSGGMRRRLNIGIAVIGSPSLIIADEPSAGLDPANRMGIWKLLGRIRENGKCTVIITTHFLDEADALCSQIGIMAGGKLRVQGNQLALKQKYGGGSNLHLQLPCRMQATSSQSTAALAAESAAMDDFVMAMARNLNCNAGTFRIQHELPDEHAEQRARGGIFDPATNSWHWEVRIVIPLPVSTDLASVFDWMANGQSVIQDWGMQQSSLEDVFLRISNKYYSS